LPFFESFFEGKTIATWFKRTWQ